MNNVQYENRILLEKMMNIERKPTDLHPSQLLKKHFQPTKSLNITKRAKEVNRINQDNKVDIFSACVISSAMCYKALVTRLQGTKSVYSSKKWKEEEKERTRLRESISRNGSKLSTNNGSWNNLCHLGRFEHKDYTKYGAFPKITGSRMSTSMTPNARMTPRDFVF